MSATSNESTKDNAPKDLTKLIDEWCEDLQECFPDGLAFLEDLFKKHGITKEELDRAWPDFEQYMNELDVLSPSAWASMFQGQGIPVTSNRHSEQELWSPKLGVLRKGMHAHQFNAPDLQGFAEIEGNDQGDIDDATEGISNVEV
ncbi:hypothetical protein AMATHDRAFT_65438 [Amanita thiersii Skay4041]|uniref:Uncharacterized protein n=1 Tax=Amanita thiersii Skay4041 TaxID=703135 RepID=A0A2A9NL67_9AGAR|nr:hypothetical protein AMATHDRAFT_65438 [Amanita thiersii Skay4041]